MTDAEKKVHEYLARIGRRGGLNSRGELSRPHAKQMVAIREAKRAAQKASVDYPTLRLDGDMLGQEAGHREISANPGRRAPRAIASCSSFPESV